MKCPICKSETELNKVRRFIDKIVKKTLKEAVKRSKKK